MASNEEWEVPNSDDERDVAFISCTTKSEATADDLPLQILEYYEQIERNKVLELKVKEFRKIIPVVNDRPESEKSGETDSIAHEDAEQHHDDSKAEDKKDKKSSEPSEFDEFDEPQECQGQLPKRTPKSGRMAKKRVGTLKNVISNLKRFRDMDVTTSESNDAKKSSSDEVTEKSTSENDKPTNAGSSTE